MQSRASKRSAPSPKPSGSSPKRPRKAANTPAPDNVIVIDDSEDDADPDVNDILEQINAQKDSKRLAGQPQHEHHQPIASGSKHVPIDVDDDAAMARRLAEEWAADDNSIETRSMDVDEFEPSSDVEILEAPTTRPGPPRTSNGSAFRGTALDNSGSRSCALPSVRPDDGLQPFRDVFTRTRQCTKCAKDVKSPRGCVMFSDALPPPSLTFLLHAPCSSCRINHCRGCFKQLDCPTSCKGPAKNPKCRVLSCCAELHAVAIFETLGGFDRQFIAERAASDSRALAITQKNLANKAKSVGPGGTGYGTGGGHHTSQYSFTRQSSKQELAKATRQMKTATHWENVVVRTLNTLVELLPAPYTDDPQVYDMLPHTSIGHLISLSQLPTLLATLLRNDSVTDWISRKETYNAMLSLLRRMGDCELTIQCLIGQRWETATTCGLENWMWDDGEITWSKNGAGDLDIAPPLYTYFKKLTKQSEAFQVGAMQMLGEADAEADAEADMDEIMIQGTSLCGDIIAARDDLERAIALFGQPSTNVDHNNRVSHAANSSKQTRSTKKGKGRDISIDFDKLYAEECERLAFKHVSLADAASTGLTYSNYNYAPQLHQTQMATRNPKDRIHLLKELAVTATSLPPGVWVRVDEVRNDAIKIMIAGPDDTPYSGGLFEFDCFIPVQYPNQPPLMHLRTTGGGTVRFNPNLYSTGKVCLSLLGTWPGRPEEQWSPKSTLLQVLVSIQSMILIDAPYYNEPGHGQANVKAPVSIAYNRDVSVNTVRWAIVDWLRDEHRNGIWRDVIASHFTIRKDKIRQQIVEWSKTAPRIRSHTNPAPLHLMMSPYMTTQQMACSAIPEKNSPKSLDLLDAYDKGIRIIESWTIGEDAEYIY